MCIFNVVSRVGWNGLTMITITHPAANHLSARARLHGNRDVYTGTGSYDCSGEYPPVVNVLVIKLLYMLAQMCVILNLTQIKLSHCSNGLKQPNIS